MRRKPDVFAKIRGDVTLVHGMRAQAALKVAVDSRLVDYSNADRGWVIPTTQLDNVDAYCQTRRWLLIIHDTRRVAP